MVTNSSINFHENVIYLTQNLNLFLSWFLKSVARVIEEEIFGIDNLCWISANATSVASTRAQRLILQTGMTAFGKAYYRNQSDLVLHLAAKLEALRHEYMRFAVEKCSSVLREYRSAVETITDVLLEKGEIKAKEIWDIYRKAPRIPQVCISFASIIFFVA
ncbi:hypothetical protein BHE74_00022342 [Ensete ventricosum]|nr:hypothetical protein GW17_00043581 [Ensete ventricosum]RWW70014.1 hypothetical protein BHE74_00022342 [Ensete ventricosum]RZR86896.1 hypothetical protein BHM03_00014177 [Ensete ventricosum]